MDETRDEGPPVTLRFIERQAVRLLLKTKFGDLHGNEFETFFQDLMSLRDPGFADVRTAGRLGDIASDGLSLYEGKLYACYAPEIFDVKKLETKFVDDLEKAVRKRSGQFDTFVFVHNDLRGLHPALSVLLATARARHGSLGFEQFGYRRFRDQVVHLDIQQVEDLLGMELPVKELAYGVALEELEPLLAHLREKRQKSGEEAKIEPVSGQKLDFNEFSDDAKDDLRRMMVRGHDIDLYYAQRIDVTERDEVANAFRLEYLRIRHEFDDPDDILWQLEQYVLGNLSAPLAKRRAVMAVLAYFFESCDIFENAPPNWGEPVESKEFA